MKYPHWVGPVMLMYSAIMAMLALGGAFEGFILFIGLGLSLYSLVHFIRQRIKSKKHAPKQTPI